MTVLSIESLERLISEGEVVSLLHKSKQNEHYWALKFPYMNVVTVPHDLQGYEKLNVFGFDEVDLYCKN